MGSNSILFLFITIQATLPQPIGNPKIKKRKSYTIHFPYCYNITLFIKNKGRGRE